MPQVIAGAEPIHLNGGQTGVLLLHGFGGSPSSVRPLALALADANYTVRVPRLPGHGTSISDMMTTRWSDWANEAELALQDLIANCQNVVVIGQSMGGTLALDLASSHSRFAAPADNTAPPGDTAPAGIAGLVIINAPTVNDPDMVEQVQMFLDIGGETTEAGQSDVAKPDIQEVAYDETPLAPLMSMYDAIDQLQERLGMIVVPTLLITSRQDHVIPPHNSDHTAKNLGSKPERLWLEHSYHVAILDHDAGLVCETTLGFLDRTIKARNVI